MAPETGPVSEVDLTVSGSPAPSVWTRPGPAARDRTRRGRTPRAARAPPARRRSAPASSHPGARLPSTRALAQGARDLPRRRARGVRAAHRRGLSDRLPRRSDPGRRRRRAPSARRCRPDLRPGLHLRPQPGDPGPRGLSPAPTGRRSLRAALTTAPHDALGPGDPRGTAELRNALMSYLGRARGAAPEPEHTIVSPGSPRATRSSAARCPTAACSGSRSRTPGGPRTA